MKKKAENKVKTTGHSWDGIEEYTNPDPFWLRIVFYITLFFALGYWLLYPSWPAPNSKGILNWSSDKELKDSQAEIDKRRSEYQAEFDKASFEDIFKNEKLMKFAIAGGKSAFENNCAACHGVGGGGNKGYPNLTAGSWLWGGKIDDIYTTLKYGIRSSHDETRESQMAAFGTDKILTHQQIDILTRYVIALSSDKKNPSDLEKGNKLFKDNCASCHGSDGGGGREFGAPNLKDKIHLYHENDYETVFDIINNGRGGLMPYWEGKLSDSTIRQISIYVHQLGGGE
jgi:cytochrome c oxidase cbb3-type subunit 3